jgi:two-component system chemotaxis response regulator CheY
MLNHSFSFATAAPSSAPGASRHPSRSRHAVHDTTILVVDDDDAIREIVGDALEEEGYSVLRAENGAAALEVLRSAARPLLVLLDMMMPVMNGWEFLTALEAHDKLANLPVVVISAVADRHTMGGKRVLTKPIDLMQLIKVVEEFCT